jgi:hypothetical protein
VIVPEDQILKAIPATEWLFCYRQTLYLTMWRIFLIMIIVSLSFGCSETYKIQKKAEAVGNCEKKWQYFKLTKPIKGVVLLHTKGYCGYFHIHANTIIIINNADTIRINGPCYTENTVVGDSVLVNSYETDNVTGATGDLKYDCTIVKTCYGIITKINR